MNEGGHQRRDVAFAMLKVFPPIIQEALTQSETFTRAFDFELAGRVSFSCPDITFERSAFFSCVRLLHSREGGKVSLKSVDGDEFEFEMGARDGESFIDARSGNRNAELPSFWFLSPDAACRVRNFKALCSEKNIIGRRYESWLGKITAGPLSDAEISVFISDIRNNVSDVAASIRTAVASGSSPISALVPESADYYIQLVGDSGESQTLSDYTTGSFKHHISELFKWNKSFGLAQALLVCAQGGLSKSVNLNSFDEATVLSFFEWLSTGGDRFSQVAGVEVGLGLLTDYPLIESHLVEIISAILQDNDGDQDSRLRLSSSIFVFVDGELSRLGILRSWPPFLRRIASLAQAALIERELLGVGVESGKFSDWAVSGRGNLFFLQSLADLRLEPRWLPDFADAKQLKAEFLSRIANAGEVHRGTISSPVLKNILFGEGVGSVRQQLTFPFSFFPGPLEGGSTSPNALPSDLLAELQRPRDEGILEGKFFAGIVNSALVFDIKSEHAALVMEALRNANHRLSLDDEPHLTFHLLSGLAIIAAVARAPELAQDVRLLANILQRRGSTKVEPDNLLRIGLIASASYSNLPDWCKSVGEWFYDVSYGEISVEQAETMRNHLHSLCRIVPQLWVACGKSDGALASQVG